MTRDEIITQLSQLIPPEAIYEIPMTSVISAIVQRMGEKALSLTAEDLELARDEVKAAISHHFDERELISIGLDAFQIILGL